MNILLTGTPGTGKSTLAGLLRDSRPFKGYKFLCVSDLVKEDKSLQDSFDDDLDSIIMNEKAVRRRVAKELSHGSAVVECHSPGIFKGKSGFDLVVVLSTDTAPLFDRLTARAYSEAKREENITAEIMQTCLEEATEVFGKGRVLLLPNNTPEDLAGAVARIARRVRARANKK